MFSEFFGTFFYGLVTVPIFSFFVGFAFAFVLLLIKFPLFFLCGIGGLIFIFIVGLCMENYEELHDFFRIERGISKSYAPSVPPPSYGIVVLDELQRLEDKYKMSTIKFMSYFYADHIPYHMTNLDYLEWVSLINDLVLSRDKEDLDK